MSQYAKWELDWFRNLPRLLYPLSDLIGINSLNWYSKLLKSSDANSNYFLSVYYRSGTELKHIKELPYLICTNYFMREVQAYLILVCPLYCTLQILCFLQIGVLWQSCFEQIYSAIFQRAFSYFVSLCHVLVILVIFQIFHYIIFVIVICN